MKAARNDLNSAEKKSLKNVSLVAQEVEISPVFVGMAVKCSDHDKHVIEMLKDAVTSTIQDEKEWETQFVRDLDSIGSHYAFVRGQLLGKNDDKKEDEKDDKKSKNRANEIREQNTLRRVRGCVDLVRSSLASHMKYITSTFSEPVEIICVRAVIHLRRLTKLFADMEEIEVEDEEWAYEHIFGFGKVLTKLQVMHVRDRTTGTFCSVGAQVIADFQEAYDAFVDACEFDLLRAAARYPRLFIRTSYDNFLPGMAVSPYDSQMDVIRQLTSSLKSKCPNKLWIWLNTLTGEGKTTLAVTLAKLHTKHNPVHILYCCNEKLTSIRSQIGQFAIAGVIPFRVAELGKDGNVVYHNHSMCQKMSVEPLLTIADIPTTIQLLKQPSTHRTVLFFDEPTFGLDHHSHVAEKVVHDLTEVMFHLPEMTIFATATAPRSDEMPTLHRFTKQNEMTTSFVTSMRVQIGSEIVDFTGKPFVPHVGCSTVISFRRVVDRILQNGFLQKCYTANVVNRMYIRLAKLVPSIPDFRVHLSDPSRMNQPSIQALGLTYLTAAAQHLRTDEQVTRFTEGSIFETKEPLAFGDMCATFERYGNQTLVVTQKPIQFFGTYVQPYLTQINKACGCTFADTLKIYDRELTQFEEARDRVEAECEKAGAGRVGNKLSSSDREKLLADRLAELESKRPYINLPRKYILGTTEYYANREIPKSERPRERDFVLPEHIDWDKLTCLDWYQLGLAVGVGVLSDELSPSYNHKVTELASQGRLAILISDETITYGTNYPIENVVVDGGDCMKHQSVKSLFQLFARAGRPGKSWRANIFADAAHVAKIRDELFEEVSAPDVETQNINRALETLEQVVPHVFTPLEKIEEKVTELKRSKDVLKEVLKEVVVPDSWEDE